MDKEGMFSEEQIDFLSEIFNIGAGHAATALSRMVGRKVDISIPTVRLVPISHVPSILGNACSMAVCTKMGIVGDVVGEVLFVVPYEDRVKLLRLVEVTATVSTDRDAKEDLSTLSEVSNIIVGNYLTAVHDFTKLNIHHTVPISARGKIRSVLDESVGAMRHHARQVLIAQNTFTIDEQRIGAFLLLLLPAHEGETLANSMDQARLGILKKG